jgi:hypothetical protein
MKNEIRIEEICAELKRRRYEIELCNKWQIESVDLALFYMEHNQPEKAEKQLQKANRYAEKVLSETTEYMKLVRELKNPSPKFIDWLADNFTRRTEYYYDKNSNNETYSIKEIESQYVMKFRTNI